MTHDERLRAEEHIAQWFSNLTPAVKNLRLSRPDVIALVLGLAYLALREDQRAGGDDTDSLMVMADALREADEFAHLFPEEVGQDR